MTLPHVCANIIGRQGQGLCFQIQEGLAKLLLSRPGCSADGSALEWGSRGRWFKSSHSDQKSSISQEIEDFSCICFFCCLDKVSTKKRNGCPLYGQSRGNPAQPAQPKSCLPLPRSRRRDTGKRLPAPEENGVCNSPSRNKSHPHSGPAVLFDGGMKRDLHKRSLRLG